MLLPASLLLRRGDFVELIGEALERRALGWGQRPIAALLGVARSTLRGWLDRFAARAEPLRAHFLAWALWLRATAVGLEPSDSAVGDAIAALVAAAGCGQPLVGLDRWQFAAAATGGRLLCNTSAPFPAPWRS